MEDLAPLLFFLLIVAVNIAKYFIEKGGKKSTAGRPTGATPPPRRQPSTIDQFFENLAKQVAPQPQPKPSYVQDMEAFEDTEADEPDTNPWEESLPLPKPAASIFMNLEEPKFQPLEKLVAVPASPQSVSALFSGSHGLRMPKNTFLSTGKAGNAGFRITGKAALKNALLSQIIFSPPRAYDLSYDNTMIK